MSTNGVAREVEELRTPLDLLVGGRLEGQLRLFQELFQQGDLQGFLPLEGQEVLADPGTARSIHVFGEEQHQPESIRKLVEIPHVHEPGGHVSPKPL
jgi:hypothetical protein